MLDRFFVSFTNAFYFVPLQSIRFKHRFPNAKVVIACATKARMLKENQDPKYEFGWSLARRGMLVLTETSLYCGDWEIPIDSVHDAVLQKIPYGAVLRIETTDGMHYQFGVQNDPAWENQKFLPLKIVKKVLEFSTPALILRLIISIWLIWLIFQDVLSSRFTSSTVIYILLAAYILYPLIKWVANRLS